MNGLVKIGVNLINRLLEDEEIYMTALHTDQQKSWVSLVAT